MSFYLSKIIGFLISPVAVLLLFVLFSSLFRRKRLMLVQIALVIAIFFYSPLGSALILPLEERFEKVALPIEVDGIIVLGGAIDSDVSLSRSNFEFEAGADRLAALVSLARQFPDAKLVYTGGSASVIRPSAPETIHAKQFFDLYDGLEGRVVYESASRNTHENAVLSKELIKPAPGETWILVTSAFHMPRAVGVFRQAGWNVAAYPVDYKTTGWSAAYTFSLNARSNLEKLELAIKEWVGLAAYYFLGRTSELFPAPLG